MSDEFIAHVPCQECGSEDNVGVYDDGHGWCFGCEAYYAPGTFDDQGEYLGNPNTKSRRTRVSKEMIRGDAIDYKPITARRLTQEACKKFGYGIASYDGKPVQVAPYHDPKDGRLVAQHLRFKDKKNGMPWIGDPKKAGLFGQRAWRSDGKMVVVTEGEIDAISVAQALRLNWPAVSIGCGAGSQRKMQKYMSKHAAWLSGFEKVVICFDSDEAGREAAQGAAAALPPGKAYIAELPLKDASEMLVARREKELRDCLFGARPWRPEGLVTVRDVVAEARKPVEWGIEWPWDTLTQATYGIRRREVYAFGAGTGVGKTDVFMEVATHLIHDHDRKIGGIFLEQPPVETLKRLAGKWASKRFHVPDAGWTEDELNDTLDEMEKADKLVLFDHFGGMDWETVKSTIRYMALGLEIKDVFLDHLTALAGEGDDERKDLDKLMKELASLAQELNITIYFISHLATPHGTPHEEGGRVMVRHFRGSRAIGFWSHFMFGLERNQQAEDERERHTTTFRVLKDRYTGQATGKTFELVYNAETGRLNEAAKAAEAFDDEQPPWDEEGDDF